MNETYDLERFVAAQDLGGTYERAVEELRQGHKTSHWMWFVFPQIAGLGSSAMATKFAISSVEEASAYLRHPILGPRLLACARLVVETCGRRPPSRCSSSCSSFISKGRLTRQLTSASDEKPSACCLGVPRAALKCLSTCEQPGTAARRQKR
jgi:hypothetical protein